MTRIEMTDDEILAEAKALVELKIQNILTGKPFGPVQGLRLEILIKEKTRRGLK